MTVRQLMERLEELDTDGMGDREVFMSSDPEGNSISPLDAVSTVDPKVAGIRSREKIVLVLWPRY